MHADIPWLYSLKAIVSLTRIVSKRTVHVI
jgi:hypothetical protein